MSVHVTPQHLEKAQALVEKSQRNGGLAPVDFERFWEDNQKASADPWSTTCPQVPMGIRMSPECAFHEFAIKEDWYKLGHDETYYLPLAKRYNDRAEEIVGKRLMSETPPSQYWQWSEIKKLHDIFEAENVWESTSYWLKQSANTPDELAALLDRVEKRLEDLRSFMLPLDWDKTRRYRVTALGDKVPSYRLMRGPVTFATSIYGVENLIFLILDQPDLAIRFSNLITQALFQWISILDEEVGYTNENTPSGFYWFDDNCALLNVEMYEFFGYPILEKIFQRYSPNPDDLRGQHSDSDMEHLLPLLGKLKLNSVNFGPNLKVSDIRKHLPNAIIEGQLAPFTFSRNEEVNIVAEFLRDFEMAHEKRGLVFATAGSVNDGSRLSSLRLIMAAIQEYGRYE